MLSDDTYVARRLQLLGEWDAALAALDPDAEPELRAEIAVDRWFFRVEGHDEAEKAVAALDPASPTAHLLTARLAYSRLLFQRDPRADDRAVAEAGYRAAVESGDEKLRGWAEYHWAVLLDNIDEDPAGALPRYETALEIATKSGDDYFESYIIRHTSHRTRNPPSGSRCCAAHSTCAPRSAPGPRPSPRRPSSPTTSPKTTPSATNSCRYSAQVRKNCTSAGSCPRTDPPSAPALSKVRRGRPLGLPPHPPSRDRVMRASSDTCGHP
ncbi:hypothetical protein ACFW93_31430 [Streptomyces canus]|uniref:hypothetical protein n=1 Tax=Streptomyces canus TaxID=58343 RepID=UPI0036BB4202